MIINSGVEKDSFDIETRISQLDVESVKKNRKVGDFKGIDSNPCNIA